jgi:hypothetical protein
VAQLFSLGHEILLRFIESDWQAEIIGGSDFAEMAADILDGARLALICRRRASAAACRKFGWDFYRTYL